MTVPVVHTPVEILPAAANYPALCAQFMQRASGLDTAMVGQHIFAKQAGVRPGSEAGDMMGQAAAAHMRYLLKALGITTAQFGLASAALAAQSVRILPRRLPERLLGRADALTEVHADARAHVLLHHFPAAEVARLLPTALVTDEAARYMQGRQLYQLTHVIEGGLMAPAGTLAGPRTGP